MCWLRCVRRKHAEMPGASLRMHALSLPIPLYTWLRTGKDCLQNCARSRVLYACVCVWVIACSCTWVERWWCRLVPCARVALTLLPLTMRLHASRAGVALLAGASFVASSSGKFCMSRLHDRKRGSMISGAVNPRSHHANLPSVMPTNHYAFLPMQPFRRARRRASRVARLRSHNADARPPSRALRRACR
jgi:hypothetical protein